MPKNFLKNQKMHCKKVHIWICRRIEFTFGMTLSYESRVWKTGLDEKKADKKSHDTVPSTRFMRFTNIILECWDAKNKEQI